MFRIKIEKVGGRQTALYRWGLRKLESFREKVRYKKEKPKFGEWFLNRQIARVLKFLQKWDDNVFADRIRREYYPLWQALSKMPRYADHNTDRGTPQPEPSKEVADAKFWKTASRYHDRTHQDYDTRAEEIATRAKIKQGLDFEVFKVGPLFPVKAETVETERETCPLHPAGCPADGHKKKDNSLMRAYIRRKMNPNHKRKWPRGKKY